jgi:hypothetical protein
MGEITTMPTVEEKAPENILRESSSAENVESGQNISGNPSVNNNPEKSFAELFQIEEEKKPVEQNFSLGDESKGERVVVSGNNTEKAGFPLEEINKAVNNPHLGSHWIQERKNGLEV